MTPSEHLIHTTIRIMTKKSNGATEYGTGFFFSFSGPEEGSVIPVIVTNKHVVKDSYEGELVFSLSDSTGKYLPQKNYPYHFIEFSKAWTPHPDNNVDLCVMPISQFYNEFKPNPYNLYMTYLSEQNIPTEAEIQNLSHIEDITIVGYPTGLWDSVNNLPLVRRGITASSLHYDFNGEPHFIMDAAIFGGSSGSPVLIFSEGQFIGANGGISFGNRLMLVGINTAVYLHPITGEIMELDTESTSFGSTLSMVPNNLGIAIHARKLLDFKPILFSQLNQNKARSC